MNQEHLAGPVGGMERIGSIDILRGVALLGILVMNIEFFVYPNGIFFNPTIWGGFEGADRTVWVFKTWFFNQKMMSIFSMLFGAGLILMMNRITKREIKFGPIYRRRTFWLLVIGLFHSYIIWSGDILVAYAICGFVIYLFRNKTPRTLIIWSAVFFLVGIIIMSGSGFSLGFLRDTAEEAARIKQEGGDLDPFQSEMMRTWEEVSVNFTPSAETIKDKIDTYSKGSIGEIFRDRAGESLLMHTQAFLFMVVWQVLGLMLLGMALLKARVISGERSVKFYVYMAVIGLAAGLPVTIFSTSAMENSGFDIITIFQYAWPLGMLSNTVIALGYIGLVMLFVKWSGGTWIKKGLAAVGRTALSNYLLHSLICTTIFYSYGLGLYGSINRSNLMLLVLGIWLVQLIVSPLWLNRFRFGPAEWLWRSLTYKKRQPFRR